MIIFMVGYMGSGKTSLGKELGRRLGYRFADMDKLVEDKCGKTISEIFAEKGEAYFRDCERRMLESFKDIQEDVVVATGGGVPCFGNNMDVMKEAGVTVYLKMSPPKLIARLEHGRDKRPIIRGMDDAQLLKFIEEKLPERDAYYSRSAIVIDCDGRSDDYIVSHIAEIISGLKTK